MILIVHFVNLIVEKSVKLFCTYECLIDPDDGEPGNTFVKDMFL